MFKPKISDIPEQFLLCLCNARPSGIYNETSDEKWTNFRWFNYWNYFVKKKKKLELIEVQLKLNPNYLLNKGSYTSMFISSLGLLYDIVEPWTKFFNG
jgi:hypothetical protein